MNKENGGWSKWSIINFIFLVLIIIGMFVEGFEFTNRQNLFINLFWNILLLGFFGWILFLTKKSGKKGLVLSKIAFYGFIMITLLTYSVELYVSKETESVRQFAINNSKLIVNPDLEYLRKIGTPQLSKELNYSSSTKNITDSFTSVGNVVSCEFIEGNVLSSSLKFYEVYGGYDYGYIGNYSIRCYGDTGYIDMSLFLRKFSNSWRITSITYTPSNPDLQVSTE